MGVCGGIELDEVTELPPGAIAVTEGPEESWPSRHSGGMKSTTLLDMFSMNVTRDG